MLRSLVPWLVAALLTCLLLEGATRLAARVGWIAVSLPPGADYWWSGHPDFGIWRYPNSSWEHPSECFRVTYETNSVGARDVERPLRAEGPRVVVLGDSFLEGWGVPLEARLSSRLEATTGEPHLNFAMAHFSPYQALLVYQELAKHYDHDGVLLGVLPANDFLDSELELAATIPDSYLYRPYLVGEPPRYSRVDHRESPLRFFLRTHSYVANAVFNAQSRSTARRLQGEGLVPAPPPGQTPSWFYDFQESHVARLEAVLRMLAQEAEGRPVGVLLIPISYDLARYASAGPAPLADRLRKGLEGTSVQIVDLLPAMAKSGNGPDELFLPCDYHWSVMGNAVAARLAQRALTGTLYREEPAAPPTSPP
jgi:hypothetical protein